jgi:hypothetical protein
MWSLFSGLSFGAPFVLAALILLPAIWWLLRVTPPMPQRVVFPPLRLLLGLKDTEETPSRTPLWLLVLRLAAAALIIIALAEPMLGASPALPGKGALVLFVDNGWTAAHAWDKRQAVFTNTLREQQRSGRPIAILATADAPDTNMLNGATAQRAVQSLVPEPWLGDRPRAIRALEHMRFSEHPDILWLSDGTDAGTAQTTAQRLARVGRVRVLTDDPANGPVALLPPANQTNGFDVDLLRGNPSGTRQGDVVALGDREETLASGHFRFENGALKARAQIRLPLEVRNETARIVVQGRDSAGAVQLLDEGAARRAVGLVSAANPQGAQPLLSDVYYLERALSPFADLRKGSIANLLDANVSVLVLADIGHITGFPGSPTPAPNSDYGRVAKYVQDGGLLIRFAGARMTNGVDDLVPVKLRTGGRYLGGALAWAAPQHLAPFPDSSPFTGLSIPADVTVSRQVLAEPSVELSERSWARLQDGTPLVTAEQRGKGFVVLFHVTASPAWSTLPMSGLYVDMLKRLLQLSAGAKPNEMAKTVSLPALETLDGFGQLRKPPADVLPIRSAELNRVAPSRTHPPGLYGASGAAVAFNAASAETDLTPFDSLGLPVAHYAEGGAVALEPPLLEAALLLLIMDALLSLWLRGHILVRRIAVRAAVAGLCLLIVAQPRVSRADETLNEKAALDTRLAYVVTGLPDVDQMSRAGLAGLGEALKERTSYEPLDPIGVDLAHDDLSFYPLLYWPMDPREKELSPQALSRIADYMRTGGTILFDTRDLTLGAVIGAGSPGEQTLRRLLAKLDLPPLEPVPGDHVLTKAFYLLRDFPGRWDGGKVWVEALPPPDPEAGPAPARGGDGVSPVIIGGNDWAAAWAVDAQGHALVDPVPGGDRQRELALRFGINLVMYALTGNYKTDQVHVPALLERLSK